MSVREWAALTGCGWRGSCGTSLSPCLKYPPVDESPLWG
jgi:hypothetical protein